MTWELLPPSSRTLVQWAAFTHGPLPDGPIVEENWRRYVEAYVRRPDRPRRFSPTVGWGSWQSGQPIPTWEALPAWQSEFKEWIVANHGPLPDGPVKEEDWKRYAEAWMCQPDRPRAR
jgi:hypothetical protein